MPKAKKYIPKIEDIHKTLGTIDLYSIFSFMYMLSFIIFASQLPLQTSIKTGPDYKSAPAWGLIIIYYFLQSRIMGIYWGMKVSVIKIK